MTSKISQSHRRVLLNAFLIFATKLLAMASVAQWRIIGFFAFCLRPFTPQISYRLHGRAYLAACLSSCGGPLSGADRRLVGFSNRRLRRRSHTHGDTRFTPGRIITRHGMATYNQWQRIPDRSERIPESNVKNVKVLIPNPSSPVHRQCP